MVGKKIFLLWMHFSPCSRRRKNQILDKKNNEEKRKSQIIIIDSETPTSVCPPNVDVIAENSTRHFIVTVNRNGVRNNYKLARPRFVSPPKQRNNDNNQTMPTLQLSQNLSRSTTTNIISTTLQSSTT
jgi:hypothetical protein